MKNNSVVASNQDGLSEISVMINESYNRDIEKLELVKFKELIKTSRKFGFPFVCTLTDENEQIQWAAKLLILTANTWPLVDVPENFKLLAGSMLLEDAINLIATGVGNYRHLMS